MGHVECRKVVPNLCIIFFVKISTITAKQDAMIQILKGMRFGTAFLLILTLDDLGVEFIVLMKNAHHSLMRKG